MILYAIKNFLNHKRYDLRIEKRLQIIKILQKFVTDRQKGCTVYILFLKHFFLHLQFVYDKDMISKDFLGKVILTLDKLKEISHKVGK